MREEKTARFPYLEPTTEAKFSKMPHVTKDQFAMEVYKERGSTFNFIDKADFHNRFERTKVHFTDASGKEVSQNVTLSKPAIDVICLRRNGEDIEICLLLQRRSPYQTQVDNKVFVRNFWENVGGLVEEGETLEEAAIREAEEETGYKVLEIHQLIDPIVCKHVSYTDETAKIYWAVMGEEISQNLDKEEDITSSWKPLNEVEQEFEAYMDGKKETFFGFDLTDMSMLGLQRLFVKFHRGGIAL